MSLPSTAALWTGGFVALEVGLDAFEVDDGFVEAGELFFDFRDDTFSVDLKEQRERHVEDRRIEHVDSYLSATVNVIVLRPEEIVQVAVICHIGIDSCQGGTDITGYTTTMGMSLHACTVPHNENIITFAHWIIAGSRKFLWMAGFKCFDVNVRHVLSLKQDAIFWKLRV